MWSVCRKQSWIVWILRLSVVCGVISTLDGSLLMRSIRHEGFLCGTSMCWRNLIFPWRGIDDEFVWVSLGVYGPNLDGVYLIFSRRLDCWVLVLLTPLWI